MSVDDIFSRMEKKPKQQREDEDGVAHDALVLHASKLTLPKLSFFLDPEVVLLPEDYEDVFWELEAPVPGAYGPDTTGFADLKLFIDDEPRLLLEVKSKSETQSASAWHRQTRSYRRASGLPCFLVVAHDLQPYMYEYLEAARTPWFDLRGKQGK
jgi:hypothetical protein